MESNKNSQIFNNIGDLCATSEFNDAQMSFFTHNCGVFSEEEENKLEYTAIYETYVKLME